MLFLKKEISFLFLIVKKISYCLKFLANLFQTFLCVPESLTFLVPFTTSCYLCTGIDKINMLNEKKVFVQ